jgi:uncharacterized protein (AIM24 family)
MSGPFSNLGAKIVNRNGFDTLECHLQPGASMITNQDTLCYMEGGITAKATTGSSGLGGLFGRAVTGSSLLQNVIQNSEKTPRKIVFSPLLQGSIVEIVIQPGETWRFANKTFLACSSNLQVSGNVNIFRNFRMSFVNNNVTYITATATNTVGVIWVVGHGGVEKHEIQMGSNTIPLMINNGCFLGMLSQNETIDYWKDYTSLTQPGSIFNAFMTDIGFMMSVGEKNPAQPIRPGRVVCTLYTQTLNPRNLEEYVDRIARQVKDSGHSEGSTVGTVVAEGAATGILSFFQGGQRRTRRVRHSQTAMTRHNSNRRKR